ncbi:DUF4924 family protein [Draconibacterium sp. IB214405]|uniref:DUF4924 family protein n=1 Tax=Draconibacterium sp. IB214405 TaxID=3097352 RepID=UPI002A107A28|nr:DUF4924 family protein [Draconibacterium sp. IB214405]MDX8341014.1 DUF4924 family protein [Draconibacterium sp. IB214405]
MLVAKQKRKENIVEYILYLYQVEDLIRAFKLDMELIEERLVASYKTDDKTKVAITDWYANLVLMMEKEQIQEKGHLQFITNLVAEVNDFHQKLMETSKDGMYVQSFKTVSGLITELKEKNPDAKNDIDLGITAIYGFLILKMQKADISIDTLEAIKRISKWLGDLSKLYRDFESGDFAF